MPRNNSHASGDKLYNDGELQTIRAAHPELVAATTDLAQKVCDYLSVVPTPKVKESSIRVLSDGLMQVDKDAGTVRPAGVLYVDNYEIAAYAEDSGLFERSRFYPGSHYVFIGEYGIDVAKRLSFAGASLATDALVILRELRADIASYDRLFAQFTALRDPSAVILEGINGITTLLSVLTLCEVDDLPTYPDLLRGVVASRLTSEYSLLLSMGDFTEQFLSDVGNTYFRYPFVIGTSQELRLAPAYRTNLATDRRERVSNLTSGELKPLFYTESGYGCPAGHRSKGSFHSAIDIFAHKLLDYYEHLQLPPLTH